MLPLSHFFFKQKESHGVDCCSSPLFDFDDNRKVKGALQTFTLVPVICRDGKESEDRGDKVAWAQAIHC